MSDSSIGIKIADGTYYPIIERGYTGTKKLTVTTAKDNQEKVKIDLYSGTAPSKPPARFIGSLVIENIPPASQGEPEIELLVGVDGEGQLSATASDSRTGESQDFRTSLTDLPGGEFTETEFPEEEKPAVTSFEEPPLTGETYPAAAERREPGTRRRGPNIALLILFVVLGVALVAAVAYFIYRGLQGPRIPPLATSNTVTAPAQPAATAAKPAPEPVKPAAAPVKPAAEPAKPAAAPAQPAAEPHAAVSYRIKKGDTLWDIAATYYRNPWLYPKLAKANSIKNPDLIFAGTRITIPEN